MKSLLIFLAVLFLGFTAVSYADMIEVRGKGFISGAVVSEDEKEIVFKDSYGEVAHFSRSEVVYVEKDKRHGPIKGMNIPSGKSFLSGLSGAGTKKNYKNFTPPAETDSEFANQITGYLEQISQSALDFLYRGQDLGALAKTVQAKAMSKDYRSKDLIKGGIGMAIMFIGGLVFIVFAFRLISEAFERHFLWGVAFLAIPLSYVAPIIGGSIGLFSMVPYFASLCFVAKYWRNARVAVVGQIFSANIILLGFFILQTAS